MDAPKEIYLEICYNQDIGEEYVENVWRDSPIPENSTIKYLRSDLAVDREKLVGYIDNRIRFLDKLLEANDSPVVFGKLSAFQDIKDYIEKLKEL